MYLKAALKDPRQAMLKLWRIYYNGMGLEVNWNTAFSWYEKLHSNIIIEHFTALHLSLQIVEVLTKFITKQQIGI
jgi:TPR repeat protein